MNCKYHINSKIYKDCCYKKRMHKSSNEILNNDEFYNYFLIKLTNITQKSPTNNEFERICNRILSTLDLNLLKQEILNATIFIQKLQNQLNNLHLKQLEYWTKYIVEFNSFDKENLHTICKDCIRELVEQQQGSNFQRIKNRILEVVMFGILTESQLNKLHAESLVTLRNRYYDEIKKKILEITDIFLLEDREEIDNRICLLRDKSLTDNKQIYVRRRKVKLLANESALVQLLNNLNQTLLGNDWNQILLSQTRKNHYNNILYIVSIDEAFLEPSKMIQILQNLRLELYNSIQTSIDVKKINNLKDAYNWLNIILEKKEKIYDLLNNIIEKYIRNYPNGKFTNTQQEENFFNNEIDKIDDKSYLGEKQFLYKLKEKIIEIYNDEEKDHYFINLEKVIDISNENIEILLKELLKDRKDK
ncbi:hypothetical protein C2G38_2219752 [Gigaspora rosea]|uniref:Uncharacterized protein n=1 Tax=Gigaspora rosea TaxID=44941 RepID=A0A397U8J8_9GLOM|nr:hypothetical protein C2G38_2219752 [Gigaspora rosea]